MMRRLRLGVLAALLALLAPAWGLAAEWRRMPWHLVDYHYRLPAVEATYSATMDVTVPALDGADQVFIAPLWGKLGSTSFYLGLQTHMTVPNGPKGAGIIFSRWGNPDRHDARPGPGGWDDALTDAQSGEGSFAGVRLPYAWGAGRYTFLLNTRAAAEGGHWVDLLMLDHQRRRWVDAGSLRFPDQDTRFYARPVSFVEVYGQPPAPGGSVEKGFRVTFHPLRVNGNVTALGGTAAYDERVPRLAQVEATATAVSVAVGAAR